MSLASVVQKFSPLVGAALNTVLPGSSLLVSAIAHLFGVPGNSETDIEAAISADPNAAEKLKEFEIAHRYDLEQLTVQDRMSARQMNSDTTKATGKQDWALHVLGMMFTTGFFVYLSFSIFYPSVFDKGVFHDILNVEMLILSFYFGASYVQSRVIPAASNVILPPPEKTR